MSRNVADFSFAGCEEKPCGLEPLRIKPDPKKPCIGTTCELFEACTWLDKKQPPKQPTLTGNVRQRT